LNSCNGSVSDTATYTTKTSDIGTYHQGSAETNANTASDSFIIKHDDPTDPNSETDMILCRIPATTQIKLVEWGNKGDDVTAAPIVCLPGTTTCDTTTPTSNRIPVENC
jgi:hypothetical protein